MDAVPMVNTHFVRSFLLLWVRLLWRCMCVVCVRISMGRTGRRKDFGAGTAAVCSSVRKPYTEQRAEVFVPENIRSENLSAGLLLFQI